jgi:hypothetical protein
VVLICIVNLYPDGKDADGSDKDAGARERHQSKFLNILAK